MTGPDENNCSNDPNNSSLNSIISLALDGVPQSQDAGQGTIPSSQSLIVPINGQIFILESKNVMQGVVKLKNNNSPDDPNDPAAVFRSPSYTFSLTNDMVTESLTSAANEADNPCESLSDFQELPLVTNAQEPSFIPFGAAHNSQTSSPAAHSVLPLVQLPSTAPNSVVFSSANVSSSNINPPPTKTPRLEQVIKNETTSIGLLHTTDHDYLTASESAKDHGGEEEIPLPLHEGIEQLYVFYQPLPEKLNHHPQAVEDSPRKAEQRLNSSASPPKSSSGSNQYQVVNSELGSNVILTAETIYRCKKCMSTFPLETIATYHYKRVHLGINDYECKWCRGMFPGCLGVHMDLCSAKPRVAVSGKKSPKKLDQGRGAGRRRERGKKINKVS